MKQYIKMIIYVVHKQSGIPGFEGLFNMQINVKNPINVIYYINKTKGQKILSTQQMYKIILQIQFLFMTENTQKKKATKNRRNSSA